MATLPQVFVGSVLLGGYEETLVADQTGMLDDLFFDGLSIRAGYP